LAAEGAVPEPAATVAAAGPDPSQVVVRSAGAWSMDRSARTTWIRRPAGLRFDLDGVAKGWLADRALALLDRHPAAVVDADGDVAVRLDRGRSWWIGIGDPDDPGMDLATLRLVGDAPIGPSRFGIATSGTSIHRWGHGDRPSHHLIDPRTGRPAATDVVQATVVGRSAREAEAYAKTAVILGSTAGLAALDRAPIEGAVLLTEQRELLILPRTLRFLP
jgi:thiamine biosynthesis lipoprotein